MKFFWFVLIITLLARMVIYFYQPEKYADGVRLRITERVLSEPIRYERSQYLKIRGLKIYLPLYPEVYYGDQVVVDGIVEDGSLKNARLVELKEGDNFLYKLRKKLIAVYTRALPQPHSALLAGVTLGSKASLPAPFWEALKKTGTAHVVVASGMNVTLVSQFLISFIALVLPRRKAIPLAILGIWSYALISGFDAPIIRASIMGSLVFVAQELGKLSFSIRTLAICAFAMLFIKPEWIVDLGFLLSFAATLSLIIFEPKVDKLLIRIPKFIRKDLSTSFAAQVGVVPVLFVSFGQFNLLSPFINALVLWTIVPMTIIGMFGGFVGLFSDTFGRAVLSLAYPFTYCFIFVINLFS